MHKTYYPSNLTEKQWSFIENLIEPNKNANVNILYMLFLMPFFMLQNRAASGVCFL